MMDRTPKQLPARAGTGRSYSRPYCSPAAASRLVPNLSLLKRLHLESVPIAECGAQDILHPFLVDKDRPNKCTRRISIHAQRSQLFL
jgi:hypothetical protein